MNIKEGDLVMLNSHTPDLVGIVVAVGVVENRMYGITASIQHSFMLR